MCRNNETEMFRFETANFVVRATIHPDSDLDLSWDESGETQANLESGLWQAFGTVVTVSTRDGIELGCSSLWGSVYEKPGEFFSDHRSADPMNRNCSIMREANGQNVSICHYFPGMISEAIADARKAIASMPRIRK
ncbi:hypothetical protein [Bradyrhizobium sp. USDA 4508]